MASILYKFRSGTNFEALPLPGTSARLFDVKRAIVKAKKLDRTGASGPQLEFDLSVRNAMTNEEYMDEAMLLPRGTRVVVQRLPAARGHGLLARIARAESGMAAPAGGVPQSYGNAAAAQSGFYTISSRERDDEDEFVDGNATKPLAEVDEEKELAALRAVTEQAGAMGGGAGGGAAHANKVWTAGGGSTGPTAIGGAPPPPSRPHHHFHKPQHHRPNADPELREAERREAAQAQPKKRATGIPRTFLNLAPPPPAIGDSLGVDAHKGTEGTGESGGLTATLQPNAIGFEALVTRGGGQSESGPGAKKRDLDYALKLTATTIPEHLQCGICSGVVKNAMLIPWDTEGRTACEVCIRDGLTQNAFRCPLTGQDGVSPDDLLPNHGLRKAADMFIKGVMEKMDEIEQAKEAEEEEERQKAEAEAATSKSEGAGFEGDGADKGVVVTKKAARQSAKQRGQSDDLFGGDDEFGGDVFDVGGQDEADMFGEDEVEKHDKEGPTKNNESDNVDAKVTRATDANGRKNSIGGGSALDSSASSDKVESIKNKDQTQSKNADRSSASPEKRKSDASAGEVEASSPSTKTQRTSDVTSPTTYAPRTSATGASGTNRTEMLKKRGPPAGYAMGPAGMGPVSGSSVRGSSPMPGQNPAEDEGNLQGGIPAVTPPGRAASGPGRGVFQPHLGGRGRGYAPYDNQGRGGRFEGGSWQGGRGGGGRGYYPQQGPRGGPPPTGPPPGAHPPGGYPRGGWGGPPPPGGYPGRGGYPPRGGGFGGRGGRGWEGDGRGAGHYQGDYNSERGAIPPSDGRGTKRGRNEGDDNRVDEWGGPSGREPQWGRGPWPGGDRQFDSRRGGHPPPPVRPFGRGGFPPRGRGRGFGRY